MPALDGSISYARFAVLGEPPSGRALQDALRAGAFRPLNPEAGEDSSEGWVELNNPDAVDFSPEHVLFDGVLLVRHRVDALKVPAPLLKRKLEAWARAYALEHERPPPRAVKKEQKALILQQLRRQAFPQTKTIDLSWRLDTGALSVWSTARRQVDAVIARFEDSFGLHLQPLGPEALTEAALGPADPLTPTPALFGAQISHRPEAHG